jgi:hypothetical protein
LKLSVAGAMIHAHPEKNPKEKDHMNKKRGM